MCVQRSVDPHMGRHPQLQQVGRRAAGVRSQDYVSAHITKEFLITWPRNDRGLGG